MTEQLPRRTARSLLLRAFDLLWLAAMAVYVLAGVDLAPFHGDESTQLFMSHDYYYLVQQHDLGRVRFNRDAFDDPKDEMELRLINGTVGKMMMGLAWDLAGLTVNDLNQQWEWNYEDPDLRWTEWEWNLNNRRMPKDALLHAGRMSSALMQVGAVWAIFGIAWLVFRTIDPRLARLAAMSASLIYLTHPNVLLNGRRSMMEGSLAMFSALTVLAGLMLLRALRDPAARPRTLWGWSLAMGVMAGTALSSKHPALLTVAPVYAVVLVGEPGLRITRPHMKRMIAASLIMALTFLAWNPAWWSLDPLVQVKVIERRSVLMAGQTRDMRQYGLVHHGILARAETLLGSLFWARPQYAEVPEWYTWLADDIERYESSGLAGRLGGAAWAVPGMALLGAGLACIGCGLRRQVRCLWQFVRQRPWQRPWPQQAECRQQIGQAPELWMMLAWGAALVGGLFSTPVIWQRYYLPLQLAASVTAGLGAAWLVHLALRRVQRRARQTPAAPDSVTRP